MKVGKAVTRSVADLRAAPRRRRLRSSHPAVVLVWCDQIKKKERDARRRRGTQGGDVFVSLCSGCVLSGHQRKLGHQRQTESDTMEAPTFQVCQVVGPVDWPLLLTMTWPDDERPAARQCQCQRERDSSRFGTKGCICMEIFRQPVRLDNAAGLFCRQKLVAQLMAARATTKLRNQVVGAAIV